MAARTVSLGELKGLIGQEIGVSEWHEVKQEEIQRFAEATHDHQWIHLDVERAKKESPFGGTIAHGYYTLSLGPYLMSQIWNMTGVRMGINYGLNKLRYPSPMIIGKRVRARATLTEVQDVEGGVQAGVTITFEAEGQGKPVCVAEALFRYYT
jgi:acyl dehydratase